MAHPRSRGENARRVPSADYRTGLIPAHAGKTTGEPVAARHTGAHPRSRGENSPACGPRFRASGSSPLTRGKQSLSPESLRASGLIPAHAGKTHTPMHSGMHAWAHPRSRGENVDLSCGHWSWSGSSPLTRGKLHLRREAIPGHGLIPAHAGKTDSGKRSWIISRAHPRSRGENGWASRIGIRPAGSSPLTRGKPAAGPAFGRGPGLIPAHAGKTASRRQRSRSIGAHPRSRGENLLRDRVAAAGGGSSPLTRGKPHLETARRDRRGLIPAHAGKTRRRFRRSYVMGAHPRSRGENMTPESDARPNRGSSPLTRGKHLRHAVAGPPERLIPAHAGKTRSPHG